MSATTKPNFKFVCWMENKDTVSVNPKYIFTVTQGRQINAIFSPLTSSPSGLKNSIQIYPNPATGKLYLNLTDRNISKIRLVDSTGKVFYSNGVVNQNESIDVSHFISGIYVVQIYMPDEIYTTKIRIK